MVRRRLGPVPGFGYVVCDVFTQIPLTGNQLAVFTDARELPEERLQQLAREMNFSETVFVYPPVAEGAHAKIRIFTPGVEVPLPAIRPSARRSFSPRRCSSGEIRLETGRGGVPVRLEREEARTSSAGWSSRFRRSRPTRTRRRCSTALGVSRSELPVEVYDNGLQNVFVTLGSEAEVAALASRPGRLAEVGEVLGVNCIAGSGTRWKTRMFIPSQRDRRGTRDRIGGGPALPPRRAARPDRVGDEIEITQGVEIGRP